MFPAGAGTPEAGGSSRPESRERVPGGEVTAASSASARLCRRRPNTLKGSIGRPVIVAVRWRSAKGVCPSRPNWSRSTASSSGCFVASRAGSSDSSSQTAPEASLAVTLRGSPTAAVTWRSTGCCRRSRSPEKDFRSREVSSGSSVFHTAWPGWMAAMANPSRAKPSSTCPVATASVLETPPWKTS